MTLVCCLLYYVCFFFCWFFYIKWVQQEMKEQREKELQTLQVVLIRSVLWSTDIYVYI